MPLGDRIRDLFDGDDDGLTETEYETLHRDDPPPRPEPRRELSHPLFIPDLEEGPWR